MFKKAKNVKYVYQNTILKYKNVKLKKKIDYNNLKNVQNMTQMTLGMLYVDSVHFMSTNICGLTVSRKHNIMVPFLQSEQPGNYIMLKPVVCKFPRNS